MKPFSSLRLLFIIIYHRFPCYKIFLILTGHLMNNKELIETILQHVYTMLLILKKEDPTNHTLEMPLLTARAIIPLVWLRESAPPPFTHKNKHTQKY